MPKKTRPPCPAVSAALVEWLKKTIPETRFSSDALKMSFEAGQREVVLLIEHQYELQQKKDA